MEPKLRSSYIQSKSLPIMKPLEDCYRDYPVLIPKNINFHSRNLEKRNLDRVSITPSHNAIMGHRSLVHGFEITRLVDEK